EVMAQEVTRRVESELWLRQSERKYRRLVEGFRSEYIIYTRDSRGMLTYVSPSIEDVLGYPRAEVLGRNWRELMQGRDDGSTVIRRRDVEDHGRALHEVVLGVPRRDGSMCILEVQEWSIFGIDGRCLAMEGIAKDVTRARAAEVEVRSLKEDLERRVALRTEELSRINEELRASEARYRDVVETQSESIVRWTPDGKRTFVNDAYCRSFGGTIEELIGTSFMPLIHPDDRTTVDRIRQALTPERPTISEEARMYAPDGTVRWTHWTTRALFDANRKLVECQSVGRDVTDLKEAEDLLRQKEAHLAHLSRLATMGEMVAGIAHEINQPLHAAKTFAEAARRHLQSGRPGAVASAIDCCNEISQAVVRTVEIIHRLRAFTKESPVKLESLDLNEIARGAAEMMAYEFRASGARLRLDLAPELPPIRGDRIQLEQVGVNLLKNACDAVATLPRSERKILVRTFVRDGRVCMGVKDSGVGLGDADAARIFDAFYSTKADGMGMGLSLCKSIAEAHRMHLGFEVNQDQRGLTFHIELPAQTTEES
ncbi:MAG TPA: PAS domain S-box protein, partial [Lacipirellulaceae bacterium]|nr:PAS domain S-box protein [Lacipirellulaceae bacterium]